MNESGGGRVEGCMNAASKAARESRFTETELWYVRHPRQAAAPRRVTHVEAPCKPPGAPSPLRKAAPASIVKDTHSLP